MKKLELTAVYVECEEGGYAAYVEEMDGVNGQGETLEEARESLLEALDLVVQTRREISKRQEPVNVIRETILTLTT